MIECGDSLVQVNSQSTESIQLLLGSGDETHEKEEQALPCCPAHPNTHVTNGTRMFYHLN